MGQARPGQTTGVGSCVSAVQQCGHCCLSTGRRQVPQPEQQDRNKLSPDSQLKVQQPVLCVGAQDGAAPRSTCRAGACGARAAGRHAGGRACRVRECNGHPGHHTSLPGPAERRACSMLLCDVRVPGVAQLWFALGVGSACTAPRRCMQCLTCGGLQVLRVRTRCSVY